MNRRRRMSRRKKKRKKMADQRESMRRREEEGGGRVVKEGGNENNEEEVKSIPGVPNIPQSNNFLLHLFLEQHTLPLSLLFFFKCYLSTYFTSSIYPI
jgi:hypothetical protein